MAHFVFGADPVGVMLSCVQDIAVTCDFQQCGILTCVDSDEPVQPPFKLSVAQSVTFLATNASLTADPGVASSIPAGSHTFVEIDHEIISRVIHLPSTESFKKGCCQLQAKVYAQRTACPGKSVVR